MSSTSLNQRRLAYGLISGIVLMTGGAMSWSGSASAGVVLGVQGGSQSTQKREALFEIDDSSSFYGLSLGYRTEAGWRADLAYKSLGNMEVDVLAPAPPDFPVDMQTLDISIGKEYSLARRYSVMLNLGRREIVSHSAGQTTHMDDGAFFYSIRAGRAMSGRSVVGIALLQSQYRHREIGLYWELALTAP